MNIAAPAFSETQEKALLAYKDSVAQGLIGGQVHQNFDEERVTGLTSVFAAKAPIAAEAFSKDAFLYMGIVKIDMELNPQIKGDDYFTSKKKELDSNVPQYGKNVPPSLQNRSRKDNNDIHIADVELGQYGGRAGVYKQIHENGEDASYFLVAVGGAEKAVSDLKEHISGSAEAIENWNAQMTNADLLKSNEFGYVNDVAYCNVKRILERASDAFSIRVPTMEYDRVNINPNKKSFPSMVIPDHMQTINAIDREMRTGNMVAHREVIPYYEIKNNISLYVLQGPAEPIYQFQPGSNEYRHGFPATTGRNQVLPQNIESIVIPAEKKEEYKKRLAKVFYEGSNEHPDVVPGAFKRVISQNDRSFIDALVNLGWSEKSYYDKLMPVCVKISNPYLIRPKTAAPIRAKVLDEYDDY